MKKIIIINYILIETRPPLNKDKKNLYNLTLKDWFLVYTKMLLIVLPQ
jgi:hypothetical protein